MSQIITSLPNGKSPGPDGFPSENYKIFQQELSPHSPTEMLRAYVATLGKNQQQPTTPVNFCPISLLNSDVKIFTKQIKKDQMGFVAGRQTSYATRRIINMIHYAEKL